MESFGTRGASLTGDSRSLGTRRRDIQTIAKFDNRPQRQRSVEGPRGLAWIAAKSLVSVMQETCFARSPTQM